MKQIRIFISSPGDVEEEREQARIVVQQLRRRYAGRLDLSSVLWEDFPLQADMSFQEGIDMVLSEKGVDIAVFILWSRLGSPTGALLVDGKGRTFRSGTEREWQLMLHARQRCVAKDEVPRPAIIVYTRQDDASFDERLRGKRDEIKAEEISQKQSLKDFIREEFCDAETGINVRAHHSFDHPTSFAKRLRVQATSVLTLNAPVLPATGSVPPESSCSFRSRTPAPISSTLCSRRDACILAGDGVATQAILFLPALKRGPNSVEIVLARSTRFWDVGHSISPFIGGGRWQRRVPLAGVCGALDRLRVCSVKSSGPASRRSVVATWLPFV